MAAAVVRVGIGQGVDGVVVILGVGRIDGHERDVAPVLAAFERHRPRGLGLGRDSARKDVGMPCAWIAIRLTARRS